MSAQHQGESMRSQPGRWDTGRINFDDPAAPRRARRAEFERILEETDFYEASEAHPEYHELGLEVLNQLDVNHYQCVTQDCSVIVTQLADNPRTTLSDEQRMLVLAVLALPQNASTTRIIAAHAARTRYMQVLNLAVACRTNLRDLPRIMQAAASPFSEPLTDADVAGIIATYEEMIAEATDNENGDYDDYDWDDDETAEVAAVRTAQAHLGYAEPRRIYLPPVSFAIAQLEELTIGQLSARQDAELSRVLDLLDYLPPGVEELEAIFERNDGLDLEEDTAFDLEEAVEMYLDRCINKLDNTGDLSPREKRFVWKMLGLPRNTPAAKVSQAYEERVQFLKYIDDQRLANYAQPSSYSTDTPSTPEETNAPGEKLDTAQIIDTAALITETRRVDMELEADEQHVAESLRAIDEINAETTWITRSDMARAVRAASYQVRAERMLDDDDDDDGDYTRIS